MPISVIKYDIKCKQKEGLIQHWSELELEDGAIPLYSSVGIRRLSGDIKIGIDIVKLFETLRENADEKRVDKYRLYKYDRESGNLMTLKDSGVVECQVFTMIYYLLPKSENRKDEKEVKESEIGK